MSERTCPVCNGAIPTQEGPGRRRKFCSRKCGQWFARNFNTKTCTVEGCSGVRRARGLCGTHYNRSRPNRHAKALVQCSVCGELVERYVKNSRRPVCSNECRRKLTYGDKPPKERKPPRSKELIGPIHAPRRTAPPVTVASGPKWWSSFTAGPCSWCGSHFVGVGTTAMYCSRSCARNAAKAKSGRKFVISPRLRREIYERDGWACQLCFEPIDREAHYLSDWAPSLDHIIPQSHTLIPDHSESNLRTAHRWCNAIRGDDTYYTAADLVA